jgi:hypothetical protein
MQRAAFRKLLWNEGNSIWIHVPSPGIVDTENVGGIERCATTGKS